MNSASELLRGTRMAGASARRMAALLIVSGLVWGCGSPAATSSRVTGSGTPGPTPTSPAGHAIALDRSSAARAEGSTADATQAAGAIDAFGLDLYRAAGAGGGNLVFSPTSIAMALAMARAGAKGSTATQMDAVMHSSADAAGGNGMNSLDQALAALSGTFPDQAGEQAQLKLNIANAPFAQDGMQIQQPYLDTLATKYGAGLRLVDFQNDPNGALKLINGWVSDQTEQRIPQLLDSLDPSTRLVLVNAIYLEAPWQTAFQPANTANAPFTTADGSNVSVPTMNATLSARYAAGAGWQAVELPYVGGSMAMTIIVPDDMTTFEKGLDATLYNQIIGALAPNQVALSLPRFKTETHVDLAGVLEGMGMTDAFDPDKADFSGITTQEPLDIAKVVHQANIDVDEKGTEAAAATAVVMELTGIPAEPVTLQVDKPFLFAVRDTTTGAILFLGRIADPSK